MGLYGERCLNGEVCLCDEDAYTIEGGYMVYVLVRRHYAGTGIHGFIYILKMCGYSSICFVK